MARKVLLVEDTFSDIELTKRAFQKSGLDIELDVAEDGKEALDYLFNHKPEPGFDQELPLFILLDLKLPKFDGFQVLQRIRGEERTRWIPVIVLTSSLEQQDILHSYELGANSYIRKPVDFTQFTKTIHELGRYWMNLNEHPNR